MSPHYKPLWKAVAGALKDAQKAHPEIEIPRRLQASAVKRVVGAVLSVMDRGAQAPDRDV